eukprot:7670602-Pyramimonas_sp.AAC.1
MPTLPEALTNTPGAGRCSHGKGAHLTLLGRKRDGSWRTQAKKTYPSHLCQAIAKSMLDSAQQIVAPINEADFVFEFDES